MTTFDPSRLFQRMEPQGDAGDYVRVVASTPVSINGAYLGVYLVVEAEEFGAVPAEWNDARVTFSVADFTDSYVECDPATVALRRTGAAIAAKAAAERPKERRESPWSRS